MLNTSTWIAVEIKLSTPVSGMETVVILEQLLPSVTGNLVESLASCNFPTETFIPETVCGPVDLCSKGIR